jgi:hypothetical protein
VQWKKNPVHLFQVSGSYGFFFTAIVLTYRFSPSYHQPLPSMAPNSQGQSGVLSEYNESIEALNIANDSSIAPAKVVFGSVGQLLTIVKVNLFLLRNQELLVHIRPEVDEQQTGLRRTRVDMRRFV